MPRSWTAGRAERVVQYSPGVDVRTVRAGVLLPPSDVLGGAAAAVRSVLEAHAASVNRDGGVHGRSLDLTFDDAGGSAPERAASARALLQRRPHESGDERTEHTSGNVDGVSDARAVGVPLCDTVEDHRCDPPHDERKGEDTQYAQVIKDRQPRVTNEERKHNREREQGEQKSGRTLLGGFQPAIKP